MLSVTHSISPPQATGDIAVMGNGASFSGLPTVGDARGKMFLLNRLNGDYRFGVPLQGWVHRQNCHFIVANEPRKDRCRIFVQDRFKHFHVLSNDSIENAKLDVFLKAYSLFDEAIADMSLQRKDQSVLLNYASVSLTGSRAVLNIKPKLLNYYSNKKNRQHRLGWVMFDYPTETVACGTRTHQGDVIGDGGAASSDCVSVVDLLIASNFDYAGLPQHFKIR